MGGIQLSHPVDRIGACSGEARVASLVCPDGVFVFHYLPTRAGRAALYEALLDYLRRGLIGEQDVHLLLLSLESGRGVGEQFTG